MTSTPFLPLPAKFPARVLFLGDRIDTRAMARLDRIAETPLVVRAGDCGCAVIFRYGAVVMFELKPLEQHSFLEALRPLVHEPFAQPETDDASVRIEAGEEERVDPTGEIVMREASVDRLQVLADVLAKSTVLSHYEKRIASVFELVQPLAGGLQRTGRVSQRSRELLRQIGDVLLVQHQLVGRVEVLEKPDVLWERPVLERLYGRLGDEYEIHERHAALGSKLELLSRTAHTVIGLLQANRSLRVEWYIVILILIEIGLMLWLKPG